MPFMNNIYLLPNFPPRCRLRPVGRFGLVGRVGLSARNPCPVGLCRKYKNLAPIRRDHGGVSLWDLSVGERSVNYGKRVTLGNA